MELRRVNGQFHPVMLIFDAHGPITGHTESCNFMRRRLSFRNEIWNQQQGWYHKQFCHHYSLPLSTQLMFRPGQNNIQRIPFYQIFPLRDKYLVETANHQPILRKTAKSIFIRQVL
jgi:hypothetical protein